VFLFLPSLLHPLQVAAGWDWLVDGSRTQYASLLTGESAAFLAAAQRDGVASTSRESF